MSYDKMVAVQVFKNVTTKENVTGSNPRQRTIGN